MIEIALTIWIGLSQYASVSTTHWAQSSSVSLAHKIADLTKSVIWTASLDNDARKMVISGFYLTFFITIWYRNMLLEPLMNVDITGGYD